MIKSLRSFYYVYQINRLKEEIMAAEDYYKDNYDDYQAKIDIRYMKQLLSKYKEKLKAL